MVLPPESENKTKSRPAYRSKRALKLSIPERLFVISIDDLQKGVLSSIKDNLRCGLAAGILAELALAGRIQLQDSYLVVADATSSGNALLDDLLLRIASEEKPRKLRRWIDTIGSKQTFRQVAEQLATHNVISIENKQYSWIVPYEAFPHVNASAKYWLKEHLRRIVLAGEKAEASDIVLLNLLHTCRLLRLVFTRDERKYASNKVEMSLTMEALGDAVADLLTEIKAVITLR